MALSYVLIKGAGDLASGVALVLNRAGYKVVMTEIPQPTCVRRLVSFANAVYEGESIVEGVRGSLADNFFAAIRIANHGEIAVLIDPQGDTKRKFPAKIYIDASMTKKNCGTGIKDADLVIALGPGFEAGIEVHAVIETKRGPDLGKAIFAGYAEPNTGIPGDVLGFTRQRLLSAPVGGTFVEMKSIGDFIEKGEIVALVNEVPVRSEITGTIRGLLKSGLAVYQGMKVGDIHPDNNPSACTKVTDKARAIAQGVLGVISMNNEIIPDVKISCGEWGSGRS